MTEHFDDMMKDKLDGLQSDVPRGSFEEIRSRLTEGDEAFDEGFKSKLVDLSSPVPADMWDRIQDNRDRRRPVAWWWAAAIGLLLGAGAWYYFEHRSSLIEPSATTAASKGDKETINQNPTQNAEVPGVAQRDNPSSPTADVVNPNHKPGPAPANNEKVAPKPGTVKTSTKGPGNSVIEGDFLVSKAPRKFRNSTGVNDGNKQEISDNPADHEHLVFEVGRNSSQIVAAQRQIRFRQMIRASLLEKLTPAQLLESGSKLPIIPCPLNGDEPRNDWYVDLYASPTMIFKKLSANGRGKSTITGMDSNLHRQVSFNAGFNLVKSFGKSFLLKTGLVYNQVNEVFRQTRINEIKVITTVTIRTVILSPGDTIYIRDTSLITQIGTVTRQSQNHYKSWDIPLILGYEFGGKDLRLNANIGLVANIRSSYKGEIADSAWQTIDIAKHNNTGVYKAYVGFGLYAGLAVLKSIGPKMDLLVEPHARFNLNNMTVDPLWFRQRNIIAGVSVGIRYKLNGGRQRP